VTTAVRRKTQPKVDPVATFREHIVLKTQGAAVVARAEALKERLKEAFAGLPGIYENENGSLFFDFPQTISDGKADYKGMELRRSLPTHFDEEIATKILKRKGVYEEALTPVLDQEKVYRLLQEGKITEADMDKIIVKDEPRWSFYATKGEVL
jgi:hypothetical protein